jgi:hypothetical protein
MYASRSLICFASILLAASFVASFEFRGSSDSYKTCCRYCSGNSVACGNTCVDKGATCHVKPGCACNKKSLYVNEDKTCCRYCSGNSVACGNACVDKGATCHVKPGCACNKKSLYVNEDKTCCRYCSGNSVACGNACVDKGATCHVKPGCACNKQSSSTDLPMPFTRALELGLRGKDVMLLSLLLARAPECSHTPVPLNDTFSDALRDCVVSVQKYLGQPSPDGVADSAVLERAEELMDHDGYTDDGTIPEGFLYKVYIPVYRNRSLETQARLIASNGTVLLNFTVRTHGQNDAQGQTLNQFSGNGVTPTGLTLFDLNSPEDDPKSFGIWPVNRAVEGLRGNAAVAITGDASTLFRNGILMHTGEWQGWDPSQPMPNSHGCIHAHPDAIQAVWQLLVQLGVVVRNNTDGALPYPYKPQGLLSVELIR